MAEASDVQLLPVIVGGLLAMGGGLIAGASTIFISWRKDKTDLKVRRAEKIEQLAAAIYEFDHWLETKQSIMVYLTDEKLGPSPFYKIQAIAAVYFPALLPQIALLKGGSHIFTDWIAKAALKRLEGNIAGVNEGLTGAYNPYLEAQSGLLVQLIQQAQREFD